VPNIGLPELLVVLMILLVVFGGSRLPAIGESLGRAMRGIKRGFSSDERIDVRQVGQGDKVPSVTRAKEEATDAEIVDRKS